MNCHQFSVQTQQNLVHFLVSQGVYIFKVLYILISVSLLNYFLYLFSQFSKSNFLLNPLNFSYISQMAWLTIQLNPPLSESTSQQVALHLLVFPQRRLTSQVSWILLQAAIPTSLLFRRVPPLLSSLLFVMWTMAHRSSRVATDTYVLGLRIHLHF